MCASEMIEHRKNSWELYGFDFMVDDEYNAWLIEINSSPACDYSTSVTERYVQKALVELLAVVLDVREYEAQPKKARGPPPDTGGWERIYQGPLLDMPVGAFGTEMSLKGEAYKNLPPRVHAGHAVSVQQIDLAGSAGASGKTGPSAMSAKLRASVSLHSAQHQASGESGPDSPQRVVRAPVQRGAKPAKAPTLRAAGRTPSTGEDTSPTTVKEEEDEFNDSDGEEEEAYKKSASQGAAGEGRMLSDLLAVSGQVLSRAAMASDASAKVPAKAAAAPAVASIPIKVFSVEF